MQEELSTASGASHVMLYLDIGIVYNGLSNMNIKVCIVLPTLSIGGAEMHVLSLLGHLDTSCFTVSLMCPALGDAQTEAEASRHVESFTIAHFRRRNLPVSFSKVVRFLKTGTFDIVHIENIVGRIEDLYEWLYRNKVKA